MMRKVELAHVEFLQVSDGSLGSLYCGSDQEWYAAERQRLTGCGPSAAANILFYNKRKRNLHCCGRDKAALLLQMEDAWQYVTPRTNGIISTAVFIRKVENYAKAHGDAFMYFTLDIPEGSANRPSLYEVVDFLEKGLLSDTPIAFLNLSNGQESNLERWHWVTITALEYDKDVDSVWISICDEGICKRINLTLWLQTTDLGGGFAYFMDVVPKNEE